MIQEVLKNTPDNTLPLGVALLNDGGADFNAELRILNTAQEIYDDFILDNKYKAHISTKLALIYASDDDRIPQVVQDFAELAQNYFEVSLLDFSKLTNFSGSFGDFKIDLDNGNVVEVSQAVLFVQEEELMRFRGVFSVADFENEQLLIETLQKNLGTFSYRDVISYNGDICQFHQRRERHCAKCAEICPTFGVGANESLMELVFSQIDCIGCGACVGVCPTHCLELEELPKEAFGEVVELYKDRQIFLCDKKGYKLLESCGVKLPDGILPLVLPSLLMLNENDLLKMLQTTTKSLLVFTETLNAPMQFLNNITNQIYKKDSIILVDLEHLKEGKLESLQNGLEIPSYLYKDRYNKPLRESFAQRVQFMIKDNDFGLAKSIDGKAPLFYGDIQINRDSCTLCLTCVGSCNVNAIFAREDDYSLRFNPSLCTTCGYCVESCPEQAMVLNKEGMRLEPSYFKSREMSKDEPFNCAVCGKVFTTKKSIDKVVSMLSVAFSGDEKRLKTLQCCPDCKVKIMFGAK